MSVHQSVLHQRSFSASECSTSGRVPPALKTRFLARWQQAPRTARLQCRCSSGGTEGPKSWQNGKQLGLPNLGGPFAFAENPAAPYTTALPRLRPSQQPGGSSPGHATGSPAPDQGAAGQPHRPPANGSNGSSNGASAGMHQPKSTDPPSAVPAARVEVSTQTISTQASSTQTSPGDTAQGAPSAEDSVAEALARAQDAISRAESSLESIEDLPSARPPNKFTAVFQLIRTAVIVGCLSVALIMSHAFGLGVQLTSAMAAAMGIAWWGYTRSALSASGALAALVVGAGTIGCSLRFGATLLAFFFSSSKLTSFKEEVKEGLDDQSKAGGQRDWKQVLCNGAIPMAIAVAYGVLVGCVDVPFGPAPQMEPWRAKLATLLGGAFLGYYAACCGDTWASELGPLSSDTPRLITTWRPVRRGTNGGVTLLGLSASILGGMFVGAVFYVAAIVSPTLWVLEGLQAAAVGQWRLIPLGLMAGLTGSVMDSVLGATLQYTGYNRATGRVTSKAGPDVTHISGVAFLDNNMVNMVSATSTAGLTALAALSMFGC